MNKITSIWDAPRNRITDKHIYLMMNSRLCNCIINEMVGRYITEDYDPILYNELKNVAYEGFWKAIKKYNPKLGKFTTFATYMCRGYVTAYIEKNAPDKKIFFVDVPDDEHLFNELIDNSSEDIIENKLLVNNILDKVSKSDKKILTRYYLKDKKRHNNAQYYSHNKNINSSLERARKVI
jgi:RNA polymerase sigma factor (sigma-70 family)